MKAIELILWIASLTIIFVCGFFFGAFGLPHKEIIERNVTVEVLKECPVCVPVQCPVCPECVTERTIEKIIEKPCPECRCLCKVSGAWEDNRTWWYNDNQTTGETP